jgi:hypothetical protein
MHNGLNQFGQVLVDYLRCTAGVPHSRHPKKSAAMPTQQQLDSLLKDSDAALKRDATVACPLLQFSHWLDKKLTSRGLALR